LGHNRGSVRYAHVCIAPNLSSSVWRALLSSGNCYYYCIDIPLLCAG